MLKIKNTPVQYFVEGETEKVLYATDIKSVEQFIPKCTKKEFKSKFIKLETGIVKQLEMHGFDIGKLWSRNVNKGNIFYPVNKTEVMSDKIKI